MRVSTFLMFHGAAEEAMKRYVSLIPNSRIVAIERYGPGESGKEGTTKQAVFELNKTRLMCIDSPVKHPFTFTPATSLFIDCDDPAQIDHLFECLSEGGQILMPLGSYDFSHRFGWVQDKYGISWQLNLP
jgi:predicted 3-demethylubiquinone-9 3-methyltransferase (glyoxalase superfamily)